MTTQVLNRETFTLSRELEFFQERELTAQIGIERWRWPYVVLKELIDNALDAAETDNIAPEIKFKLDSDASGDIITVSDNGPGLPADTVDKILDFTTRTSNKEAYRSPTRGQQGNALKTILAIPFVMSGKESRVVIESCGVRHDIKVKLDTIAQRPNIEHNRYEIVKNGGCSITVYTCIKLDDYLGRFLQILKNFVLFNPHLTLSVEGIIFNPCGGFSSKGKSTNPEWQKWKPSDPTSPYWYSQEDFNRLISAYIAKARDGGRDYTLREFVSKFRGLSATQKQKSITDYFPDTRRLSDLVKGETLDTGKTGQLLILMKGETKPVPPELLGIIGEEHFKNAFGKDDIKYYCYKNKGEIPFIVEAAFTYAPDLENPEFAIGLNFTPSFTDPFSTYLQATYRKDEIQGYGINGLSQAFKLTHDNGAVLAIHIAHPALIFRDRGKATLAPSEELKQAVGKAIGEVLKEHCANKKQADKAYQEEERRKRELQKEREKIEKEAIPSLREAVFKVLQEAADKASGNGTLPYSVRQLYYQVRPLIQEYTLDELKYSYFTPALVTEYEEKNGPLKGLIYDARGHLHEPHNGIEIALGTLDVANYQIPEWEYDKILYIEKEGFQTIFEAAGLGKRFDMAIMTAKGFATRAAKQLLSRATGKQISILVAHDSDIAGYEIARTLSEETRTSRGLNINVIDIGLKVKDALLMGLEKERVEVKREMPEGLNHKRENGEMTNDEFEFLKNYRIELNAMTTDQLVFWIERKLVENKLATKVVPPDEVLSDAIDFKLNEELRIRVNQSVRTALEEILGTNITGLENILFEALKKPATTGHRDDLKTYMANCPERHWRTWAEMRAQKLAMNTTSDIDMKAINLIREALNKGAANTECENAEDSNSEDEY